LFVGFKSLVSKVLARFEKNSSRESVDWCSARSITWDAFATLMSEHLAQESALEWRAIEAQLELLNPDELAGFGGGGCVPLLYFLVRYLKPDTVVESGVAAGWSSEAILRALHKNKNGHLFSSDLPYLFRSNSNLIGLGVSEKLKYRWTLNCRGDREALPSFLAVVKSIDLLHYDSDKSFKGRQWFLNKAKLKLTTDSVVVMDDIDDNVFFKEFVELYLMEYYIIKFDDKYVGVITDLKGFL
jgi:predicted O-methyltransferase YrrM